MMRRSLLPRLKTVTNHRCFTQPTATLRLPSNKAREVWCVAEGAPDYTVVIERTVGCELAGRDLGPGSAKVDLIFYGGCHFACDERPESPRLTLTQEVSLLLNIRNGAAIPAALYHAGCCDGSAIALKGTEGEKMCEFTAVATTHFDRAMRNMKYAASCNFTSEI